jgi:Uma2 family endonuclease
MSEPYQELIAGQTVQRLPPPSSHEILVERLHELVARSLPLNSVLRLLMPRTELELGGTYRLRPDMAVVRVEDGAGDPPVAQLYLVAEVLLPGDHHVDTVVKKKLWSDARLPRLWMVDPRYLNVEVYACGKYGFTLLEILAHNNALTDPHFPGLACPMQELFAGI